MFSARRRWVVLACGVLLSGLVSASAWAQLGSPSIINGGDIATGRRNGQNRGSEKPPIPPPDAIPGAKARVTAAPATRALTDMAPNDALFDAINRGDIAAARDSLNRGANLDAVNILGMTPMELSVDLGRNDISFLLLSMRGEDSDRGSRSVARQPPAAKPVTVENAPATARRAASARTVAVATRSVAARPVAAPKLFANDGGTPLPSAGFLGFDARSAAN
ncbi:ankyrin repeat domain-containing protein [Rhodopila sp.]|uniref:ankyrin repeat domain-containing protein n=1 Tax=Rhodopila sp. TaxID=2480087 RepID=UPI003D12D8D3